MQTRRVACLRGSVSFVGWCGWEPRPQRGAVDILPPLQSSCRAVIPVRQDCRLDDLGQLWRRQRLQLRGRYAIAIDAGEGAVIGHFPDADGDAELMNLRLGQGDAFGRKFLSGKRVADKGGDVLTE